MARQRFFWGTLAMVLAVFVGGALFAQSAESDFETAPDEVYGGVAIGGAGVSNKVFGG